MVDAAQLTALEKRTAKGDGAGKGQHPLLNRLGNHYQNKIDVLGKSASVEAGQPLLF